MAQRTRRSHGETVTPDHRITIEIRVLEDIEDRLLFLAEVLSHDPCLEDHHIKGLATILGDIGTDVWRIHSDENGYRCQTAGRSAQAKHSPAVSVASSLEARS